MCNISLASDILQVDARWLLEQVFVFGRAPNLAWLLDEAACHRAGSSTLVVLAQSTKPLDTLGNLILRSTSKYGTDVSKMSGRRVIFQELLDLFIHGALARERSFAAVSQHRLASSLTNCVLIRRRGGINRGRLRHSLFVS